jgi:hypothetical protein
MVVLSAGRFKRLRPRVPVIPTPVVPSPTISLSSSTSFPEGNSGTGTVSTFVTVVRNGALGALVVNLTYGGTATAGVDYVAGPATVTIPDGQTSTSFNLTINGDATVEGDETAVIAAQLAAYPSATASRTITLANDDVATPDPTYGNLAGVAAPGLVRTYTPATANPAGPINITLPFNAQAGDKVQVRITRDIAGTIVLRSSPLFDAIEGATTAGVGAGFWSFTNDAAPYYASARLIRGTNATSYGVPITVLDTTAFSTPEDVPVAITLTFSKPVTAVQLSGIQSAQFEIVAITAPTTTVTMRAFANGTLDYDTAPALGGGKGYTFQAAATDPGGQTGAPATITVTVTQAAGLTNIVIEGDSLTSQVLGGDATDYAEKWSWRYAAAKPSGTTVPVRAQGSRFTGNLTMLDLSLNGTAETNDNTLFARVTEDCTTYGGQLIWAAPFLTNDFVTPFHGAAGATRAGNIKARLAELWAQYKSKGAKFAFGFCPPQRTDATGIDDWNATRAAFISGFRDPAVWGLYADFYIPVGEQPDFNAADNTTLIGPDKVHPTVAGQDKLLEINKAALDTLFDGTRATSTQMVNAAWPASETGLPVSTQITRRFVVKGLAHKGLALTGSNALSATNGATISLNGSSYSASKTGWLYNGDTVDLRLTTSASGNTAVTTDLKVGTETRTLSFTTMAVAPSEVTYTHGNVEGLSGGGTVYDFGERSFPTDGLALIKVATDGGAAPSLVEVGSGSSSATLYSVLGDYGDARQTAFLIPVTAGSRNIKVTLPGFKNHCVISWGVLTGANATPLATPTANLGDDPHVLTIAAVTTNGLAIAAMSYGAGATPPTFTLSSGTAVDVGSSPVYQGGTLTMAVARRSTAGDFIWGNNTNTPHPRGAVVVDPA